MNQTTPTLSTCSASPGISAATIAAPFPRSPWRSRSSPTALTITSISAARAFSRAAALDRTDALARLGIAHALKKSEPERAATACRDALRLAPSLAEAEFLLAALEGKAPARGAPGSYVRTLFDKYAAGF